jgi:flagellar assembly factor FliW
MQTIHIQGTELAYDETSVVTFDEGLIGLPQLRRMVLVRQTDIEPFMWLASLEDEQTAFLVVEPLALFPDYAPHVPDDVHARLGAGRDERLLILAIVLIAPDWELSTVNLRAPLFISPGRMRGAQVVLTDSSYLAREPLPFDLAA